MSHIKLSIDNSNDRIVTIGRDILDRQGHRIVDIDGLSLTGDPVPADPHEMILGTLTTGLHYTAP